MQHARSQPGQTRQRGRAIEVARQWRDTQSAQGTYAIGRSGQRQHTQAPLQVARHALAHVATAHDQKTLAAKARRQGAQGVLV